MKNIREVITDILVEHEKEETYLQLVLKEELDKYERQDRNFITEVVYGTVKYKITLDYIIDQVSKTPVKKMKPFVRSLMRMSVYQIIYLNKVPSSAAINEAVKIIKRRKMSNLSGFVNGVLRNVDRNKENFGEEQPLFVKCSMPEWIVDMWIKQYGVDETEKICEALNKRAKVCARINTIKCTSQQLKTIFEQEGINTTDANVYKDECMYLDGAHSVANLTSFIDGKWTAQDESAMLVSKVVCPQQGENILDLCSAPGGKSVHMAGLANNQIEILSSDIHEHKIELIEKTATRLGVTCIKTKVMDATIFDSTLENKFDKVLTDVPCSGLGIIKRKPDIRHTKSQEDIQAINDIQKNIVKNAVRYLKSGGTLVYSTCTLSQVENEDMVRYIIDELGLKPDNIDKYIPVIFKAYIKDECCVQILPYVADTDGFFVARFRK